MGDDPVSMVASLAGLHAPALAAFTASFLASLVEAVEALTVVLAVGTMRGWRNAIAGTCAALLCLAGLITALGPKALPSRAILLTIGLLTLLFGLRWLRKAILRAAGILPLHDETRAFQKAQARLGGIAAQTPLWDMGAMSAAFQVVMLEGVEVAFIVVAVGANAPAAAWLPAVWGAGAALLCVVALGVALHRPLARVPENTLKFLVGAMMCGFGVAWLGEGMGVAWGFGDFALPALSALFGLSGLAMAALARAAVARGRVTP